MALQYRAVWRDDRPDAIDETFLAFQRWLTSKRLHIDVPSEGQSSSDKCEVETRRAAESDATILQIWLVEHHEDRNGLSRWMTTVTCISQPALGWIWIDVERESDDIYGMQPPIAAPNIAGTLLKQRNDQNALVQLGPTPRRVSHRDIGVLLHVLFDTERTVPLVLLSADPSITPQQYEERAKRMAKDLAGCADVRMLTADSEDAFNEAIPDVSLKVYRGGARVYLPRMEYSNPQPYRHRYIMSGKLTSRAPVASRKIAQMVLPMMLAQSPPDIYRRQLKPLIDRRDWEEIAIERDNEVTDLKYQVEDLKIERSIAYEEATNSEREIETLQRRNELLRNKLRELSESPEAIEAVVSEESGPETCAEAIQMAKKLQGLMIHSRAPVEIGRLDAAENSELWAGRIWRQLNSLNAYAEAGGPGYQTWCETSGHDRVISSKFIAMSESESVMKNPDLRRRRTLPVDPKLDSSGWMEMEAHLKPVEGGGMQIPRIYFHDDTKGRTGKVHIGFIGPHDRMPNQSTN